MSSHDAVSAVGAARAAFGGLTDRVRVGASRLTLKGEAKDLAVAVTKATNHDVVPPKEKHVQVRAGALAWIRRTRARACPSERPSALAF